MKKLCDIGLTFIFFILSSSAFACEKYGLWLETPALGNTQENQKLFNHLRSRVSKVLVSKNYSLIPYGSYTRDLTKKSSCEIIVEVSQGKRSKLNAEIRIEEFEFDMSEVSFQVQGEIDQVLEAIPQAAMSNQ